MTDPSALALFWAAVIAAAILIYVVLDGFDIGVGILFGTTRDEAVRRTNIACGYGESTALQHEVSEPAEPQPKPKK